MADIEQRIINTQLNGKIEIVDAKLNQFMDEMRDFKNEMRDRDNQRHAEIAELRDSIKEIYTTTDSKIDSIRQSIQTMQNQNVVVIIGVIAIAVAVFLK